MVIKPATSAGVATSRSETMNRVFGLMMVAVLLVACSDGVPKVDDPNHPLDASGKSISGLEFIKKYCVSEALNKDCMKVRNAVSLNSDKGGLPKGY
jgi:hypothetical protein